MARTTLTNRQKRFVEFYLQTWNATASARLAGYKAKADVIGPTQLKMPLVAAAIQERLQELQLKTDDILPRISEQATMNYADFFIFETTDGVTKIAGVNWEVFRERGHLVKKLSYDRQGNPVLEFHDAQAALFKIGTALGVLTDRMDMTSKGEKLDVVFYMPDNGRDDAADSNSDDEPQG